MNRQHPRATRPDTPFPPRRSSDLKGRCAALDRAGQGIAAERAEPDRADHRLLALPQGEPLVVDHENEAVALHRGPRRREIERHDGNPFQMDVFPYVELGPVGEGEDADALAPGLAGIVETPEDRKSTRLNSSH